MANLLTSLRLVLLVPVALAFANPALLSGPLLLLLLLAAIASDYFDGKVARARGTASNNGQLFDHSSDFIFVTTCLTALAWAGLISYLLPLLIVIAFSQYVIDSYFLYRQKKLRMNLLGRWNGIFYFVPLLLVASSRVPVLDALSSGLLNSAVLLSQMLILTTLASIVDRTVAPRRTANSGVESIENKPGAP